MPSGNDEIPPPSCSRCPVHLLAESQLLAAVSTWLTGIGTPDVLEACHMLGADCRVS